MDVKIGGFGIVYICRDRKGSMWAVKSFQDKFMADDSVIKSFYREGYVWLKIQGHTNIVGLFGIQEEDYKPHIIMEYIDGGSLRDWMNDHRLTLEMCVDLSIQFCCGMSYANSIELEDGKRGLVHRDISPDNILITKKGIVKIADFGLVKAIDASRVGFPSKFLKNQRLKKSTVAGKPAYMSPEQFEGIELDKRSDIYSFGIVLYEMLTGGPPFYDSDWTWDDFHRHHQCTLPESPGELRQDLPKHLNHIVVKCLEKDRGKRFADFVEFRKELMQVYKQTFYRDKKEETKRISALTWMELHAMALSMLNLGKLKEGLKYADECLRINPDNPKALTTKGQVLSEMGKLTEATEYLDEALRINPNDIATLNIKGTILGKSGNLIGALRCLDKAIAIDQREISVLINKANTLYCMGRFADAVESYDNILKMYQRNAAAWSGIGNALMGMGKFIEAIEYFDEALEVYPRDYIAWNNKGKAFIGLGKYREAIKCLERSLRINSNYAIAWYNKGGALGYLNNFSDAVECFNKALEIDLQDIDSWYFKGISLANLGKPYEALKCIEKALEINPTFETAQELRNKLLSLI